MDVFINIVIKLYVPEFIRRGFQSMDHRLDPTTQNFFSDSLIV